MASITAFRRTRPLLAALLLLVGGCTGDAADPVLPPPPPPGPPLPVFSIPTTLWAGAPAVVTSSLPFDQSGTPGLDLAGVRYPVTFPDPTTAVAVLPETLRGGSAMVSLHLAATKVEFGEVRLAGFSGEHRFDAPAFYDAYAWPRDGAASVLANVNAELALFDLDAAEMRTLGVPNWGMRGPGVTPDPDVFLAHRRDVGIERWRLRPVPTLLESLSELGIGESTPRQLMLMSPLTLFHAPGQHQYFLRKRDAIGDPFGSHEVMVTAEETEGVYLSPRGDRATVRVDYDQAGVAVFDAATAVIAYRVPLRATFGVDFSPDGSRLVMAGRHIDNRDIPRLLVLEAGAGEILADTTFDYPIAAVAWDAQRPYLYVLLEDQARGPILVVLRRETLEQVAMMRPPGVVESAQSCCYRAVVAPSRTTDTVHAFWFRWSWAFAVPAVE